MIHREDRGQIAVLRFDDGKANAVDTDFFHALLEQLEYLEISDHKAVVLTGSGKSFSAGVDLHKILDGGVTYMREFLPALSGGLSRLFSFDRPVVAAINGHAIAGGCILALACDRRIATDGKARLGVSELKVGVPFPVAAMEVMRFQLSNAVLQDLVLTGRLVGTEEARSLGVVDEVVPAERVLERAIECAIELGNIGPKAFALTKHQIRDDVADRIQQLQLTLEDEIESLWAEPTTLASIRTFMQATVGR